MALQECSAKTLRFSNLEYLEKTSRTKTSMAWLPIRLTGVRDEPIDQDAQEVDEADDLAARREERQAQAQRNADAETRYGPLFDQIEARRKAQDVLLAL